MEVRDEIDPANQRVRFDSYVEKDEVPAMSLRFGNFGRADVIEAPSYGEIVSMPDAMVASLDD
ncbi:hypothetical protein [Micromonospora sp. LOL_023]|uniref:hypothetical protein n=1 Tax=Micromonospora sp. LOL_023 TaxID=3345418 RepID=UPI003A86EB8D